MTRSYTWITEEIGSRTQKSNAVGKTLGELVMLYGDTF